MCKSFFLLHTKQNSNLGPNPKLFSTEREGCNVQCMYRIELENWLKKIFFVQQIPALLRDRE